MKTRLLERGGFVALLVCAVAVIACGGSKPPARTADDKAVVEDKTVESTPTDEAKPESGAVSETPDAKKSDEPACPHDTSLVVESKIGKISVSTGCVSPKAAESVLAQYYKDLHGCFSQELRRDRKAKGGLSIRINIGQKGTYSVRVIKSDASSDEYVKCLIGVLEPLPYPKPDFGGATIEFTTNLQ